MRNSTTFEIEQATIAAAKAAPAYAATSPEDRARFLEKIAERLEALGDELLDTANRETNLPLARLTGERGRTCGQLRMFANLIRSDAWLDVRIETADQERKPLPKPDLRRTQVPIGPVAVFGASNFPLAFSVPGGDTAAALAAGCPVVCKAHPGHQQTSELAGQAISEAAAETGMPEGVFSLVSGGADEGKALVMDSNIATVAFTGSQAAGRAIFNLAASRETPIPVFAEMGSVNPVFVMPGALAVRGGALAKGYADSLTLGVGQFCTNPGVVVGIQGPDFDSFLDGLAGHLQAGAAGTMLNDTIREGYEKGVAKRRSHAAVTSRCVGEGTAPALFTASAADFLAHRDLQHELFGPSAIAVVCRDEDEMLEVAHALEGQLTATVHFEPSEKDAVRRLLPALVSRAGRLVANGFPTGVEVNSAMQHGGPYPATTDSRFTSVGTAAIHRFVRPVAFQDFPSDLLPRELKG